MEVLLIEEQGQIANYTRKRQLVRISSKRRRISLGGNNLQVVFHVLVHLHDGGFVSAAVAVVRRREDSNNVAFVRPVVPIHDQLVGSGDTRQVIRMVKLFGDVLSERVASATGGNTPTASIVGVGPEQVADGTFVGRLLNAVKLSDLVKSVNGGGQTAMQTEDLILDHCGQGQIVEKFSKLFPNVSVSVFAQTFVVESISIIIEVRVRMWN